ncbi:MAG: L-threonylcarbamoyladenylate synthase [Oscillospiraceae bacterium]|nr:L-threonylcarbamoyladenylate synthase [Oscillospiraceae bacterium]
MIATEIIKIDEKNIKNPEELKKLRKAAEIIKNGGLVVFPTETVYGLGANALDANAVKKIYEAKGRPPDNPLIVHVANIKDIYKYAEVTKTAEKIIKKFMPAPLTLVLKKKDKSLDCASPGLDTVAVRMPENNTAKKLIGLAGVPVAAPSANLSGKPSPTNAEHAIKDLNGKVDIIICGENCEIGLESTVISFNSDESVNILRSGYITREDLYTAGARIARQKNADNLEPPRSPGMKYTHYSPDAPLYVLSGDEKNIIDFIKKEIYNKNNKTGFLCFDEFLEYFEDNKNIALISIISIGPKNNLREQAKNLFDALNKFNMIGVDIIYSVEPEKTGVGEAVYNRLIKAAGGKIIKL